MPILDMSGWTPEQVAEAADTVRARGAEPVITMRWPSSAELAQAARQKADDQVARQLRAQRLKGGGRYD